MNDGTVRAWGYNKYGALGLGDTTNRLSPVCVPGITNAIDIAGGTYFSLAALSDGTVKAWGINDYGQLGQGHTTNATVPVTVGGITNAAAVAAGRGQSMALLADGRVMAWGANLYGQCGLGDNTDHLTAQVITNIAGASDIVCGAWHSAVLLTNGVVMAWGHNGYGELGQGNVTDRNVPVAVSSLTNTVSLHCHLGWHTLALTEDRDIYCWGYNYNGQLGINSLLNRYSPVRITALSNVIRVAAGSRHNFAIRCDGTAFAWGYNAYGQLGLSDTATRWSPAAAAAITNATALAAGEWHSALLTGPDFVVTDIQLSEETVWLDPPPVPEAAVNSGRHRETREQGGYAAMDPLPDVTMTAVITVSNAGPASGTAGRLSIWINRPGRAACGDTADDFTDIGTLSGGQATQVTFSGLSAPARRGTYVFRAYIDSNCDTAERIEDNNQSIQSFPAQQYFTVQARTNSNALWWYAPTVLGLTNREVMIRWSNTAVPADTNSGTLLYTGTNIHFIHTNLTAGQTYYYRIWTIADGSDLFTDPPGGITNEIASAPRLMPGQILMRCNSTFEQGGKEKSKCRVWMFNQDNSGTVNTTYMPAAFNLATKWSIAGCGNFNPGMPGNEILIRDSSGNLYLLYIKYNGDLDWNADNTNSIYWTSFTAATDYATNAADWTVDAVGDIDGNGMDEVIIRGTETFNEGGKTKAWSRVLFFDQTGTGQLRSMQPDAFKFATLWTIEGTGRFNTHAVNSSSNAEQLLIRHNNNGGFYLLYFADNGTLYWNAEDTNDICWTSWSAGNTFSTNPTAWTVSAIGDVNGDRQDEIFLSGTDTFEQGGKTKASRRVLFFTDNGSGRIRDEQPDTFSFATRWQVLGMGNLNASNINSSSRSEQLLIRQTNNASLYLLYFKDDGTLDWDAGDTNSIYWTSVTLGSEYATNAAAWTLQGMGDLTGNED
jgi:alpha-tubulin suppressor-like RCC1 family protein